MQQNKYKIFNPGKLLPKNILRRTTLLAWLLVIFTVFCFALITIPQNQELILDRMELEAIDVASSIIYSNSSSLIAEEYQHVVEYCMNMIESSNSIIYIVVTKNKDQSLIFTRNGWRMNSLKGIWTPEIQQKGGIAQTGLVGDEVFHSSTEYVYSTIKWGWIHVGLSLSGYRKATNDLINYSLVLFAVFVLVGLAASLVFAKTISDPITELNSIAKKIAAGDLNAKVKIKTGDEIEDLANSFNAMTTTLRETQMELEDRVENRTQKLSEINKTLKEEIIERKKVEKSLNKYALRVESLQRIYRGIISAKSNSDIISDTLKNIQQVAPILYADIAIYSEDYSNVTTYTMCNLDGMVEIKGEVASQDHTNSINEFKNRDHFIIHDLDKYTNISQKEEVIYTPLGIKTYLCVALKYQDKVFGELNVGNQEAYSINKDTIEDIRDIANQLAVAIAQTRLNEQIAAHSKKIETSLEEKIVLLKEIHHRVKNNLQIISSLLFLQSKNVNDDQTLDVLKETEYRVKSMALVHEKLYRSDDLSKIDLKDYIKSLSNVLITSFKQRSKSISANYDLIEAYLPINISIPIGLIINEILTNALKHAFTELSEGKIEIKLEQTAESRLCLEIKDNGVGLPEEFDIQTSQSLGFKLIQSLTEQIDGKFSFFNNRGAVFSLCFPNNNES